MKRQSNLFLDEPSTPNVQKDLRILPLLEALPSSVHVRNLQFIPNLNSKSNVNNLTKVDLTQQQKDPEQTRKELEDLLNNSNPLYSFEFK